MTVKTKTFDRLFAARNFEEGNSRVQVKACRVADHSNAQGVIKPLTVEEIRSHAVVGARAFMKAEGL